MILPSVLQEYDIDISDIILIHKDTSLPYAVYSAYSVGRKSYGFVYAINGSAEFVSENQHFTAEKDSLIFLTPQTCYTVETRTEIPFEHYTVNFMLTPNKEKNGKLYEYLTGNTFITLKTQNPKLYESIFAKLVSVWSGKKNGFHLAAKSHLYNLANEFFSEFEASQINRSDYDRILPAKKFIDENYTGSITNAYLASVCDISETHMRRLLAEIFKVSPIEYQIELRMLKAKDLLLTGMYTVGEISELCGFSDQNYFSRLFKKHVGISPLRYKNFH